jgi:hypothetical protein
MSHTEHSSSNFVRFTNLYFILMGFGMTVTLFLSSYFLTPTTSVFSFPVEDAHCSQRFKGFGLHCFGDYYFSLTFANNDAYFTGHTYGLQQYPPIAIIIFRFFNAVNDMAPGTVLSLVLYYFIGIVFSIVAVLRYFDFKQGLRIAALMVSSTPFIVLLDRGNILLFVFPLLFLFLKAYERPLDKVSMIWLVLAALIKPQFLLFSLVYLKDRRFFDFLKTIIAYITCTLLAFTFFAGSILTNLELWIKGITAYQGLSPEASHHPVNLSAANTIASIWKVFQTVKARDIVNVQMSPTFTSIVSLSVLSILVLSFVFLKRALNLLDSAVLITLAFILFPSTTYSYYLCLIYPLILFYFSMSNESQKTISLGNGSVSRLNLYKYATLFILVPLGIPLKVFVGLDSQIQGSEISITFLLTGIILIFVFVFLVLSSIKSRKGLNQDRLLKFN